MKRIISLACCLLLAAPALAKPPCGPGGTSHSQTHPTGALAERPDPELDYRVVFDVTKASADPAQLNPRFAAIARFLHLLAADGVQPEPGHIVAIVHGPATPAIAGNDAYARKTGHSANPNLALIEQLRAAGVTIAVCSHAMQRNGISASEVAPGVRVDVSAMTTLANLQLRGWALIPD